MLLTSRGVGRWVILKGGPMLGRKPRSQKPATAYLVNAAQSREIPEHKSRASRRYWKV
jgi:hypothetical protein